MSVALIMDKRLGIGNEASTWQAQMLQIARSATWCKGVRCLHIIRNAKGQRIATEAYHSFQHVLCGQELL